MPSSSIESESIRLVPPAPAGGHYDCSEILQRQEGFVKKNSQLLVSMIASFSDGPGVGLFSQDKRAAALVKKYLAVLENLHGKVTLQMHDDASVAPREKAQLAEP